MEVTDIQVDSSRPSKRSLEVSIAVKIKLKKQKDVVVEPDESYVGEDIDERGEYEEAVEDEEQYQYQEYAQEYESGFSEAAFDDLQSFESDRDPLHHGRLVRNNWVQNASNVSEQTTEDCSRKSSDSNATFDMSVISEEDETSTRSEPIILQELQAAEVVVNTAENTDDSNKVDEIQTHLSTRKELELVEEPIIVAERKQDNLNETPFDFNDIMVDDFILIRSDEEYFVPDLVINETGNSSDDVNGDVIIEKESDWVSSKRTGSVSTYSDYAETSESPRITSDDMRSSNEEEKEDTELEESGQSRPEDIDYDPVLGLCNSIEDEILGSLSTETDLLGSCNSENEIMLSCTTVDGVDDACRTEIEISNKCNEDLGIGSSCTSKDELIDALSNEKESFSSFSTQSEFVSSCITDTVVSDSLETNVEMLSSSTDIRDLEGGKSTLLLPMMEERNQSVTTSEIPNVDYDPTINVSKSFDFPHHCIVDILHPFGNGIEDTEQNFDNFNVVTTTTTTTHVFSNELNFDWDAKTSMAQERGLSCLSSDILNDYVSAFKEYKNELFEHETINETTISISHDLSDGIIDSSGYFSEYADMTNVDAHNICADSSFYRNQFKDFDWTDRITDMRIEDIQDDVLDELDEVGIHTWSHAKNEDFSKSVDVCDSTKDRMTPCSVITGHDISDIEMDVDMPHDDVIQSPNKEESRPPANFIWCNDFPEDTFVTRDESLYKDKDDKLVISSKSSNYEFTELCEKIDKLNESYDLAELSERLDELDKDDEFSDIISDKVNELTENHLSSHLPNKGGKSSKSGKNYEFTELSLKVDELNELLEPVYEKKVSQRLRYKNNRDRFPAVMPQNTNYETQKPKRSHSIRAPPEKLKYPKSPCEKEPTPVDFWHGDTVVCIKDRVFDFGSPVESIPPLDCEERNPPWQYTNKNTQLRSIDDPTFLRLSDNACEDMDEDTSIRSIGDHNSTRSFEEAISVNSLFDETSSLRSIDDPVSLHSMDDPMSLHSFYEDPSMSNVDILTSVHCIDDSVPSDFMRDSLHEDVKDDDIRLDILEESFSHSLDGNIDVDEINELFDENDTCQKKVDKIEEIGSNARRSTFIPVSEIQRNPLAGMKKEGEWFSNQKLQFNWDSGIGSQEDLSIWKDTKTETVSQIDENENNDLKVDTITTESTNNFIQNKCHILSESVISERQISQNSNTNKGEYHLKDESVLTKTICPPIEADYAFSDFFRDLKLVIVEPANLHSKQKLDFDWDHCSHAIDDDVSTKEIQEEDIDTFSETKSSIADMDHINLFREETKNSLDISELVSLIPTEIVDTNKRETFESDSYSRELLEIERFEQLEKLCKESEKFPEFQWLTSEDSSLVSSNNPNLDIREIEPFSIQNMDNFGDSKQIQNQPICWDGIIENENELIFDLPISWKQTIETTGEERKEDSPIMWNDQVQVEPEIMYYMNDPAVLEDDTGEEKIADLSIISEGEENIHFLQEQREAEKSIEWFAIKQLGLNWDEVDENMIGTAAVLPQEFTDNVDILSAISEEDFELSESIDRNGRNEKSIVVTGTDMHYHGKGINECFTCKSLDTIDEKLRELSNFISDSEGPNSDQQNPPNMQCAHTKCSKNITTLPTIELSKEDRSESPTIEPHHPLLITAKRIKGIDCSISTEEILYDIATRGSNVIDALVYSDDEENIDTVIKNSHNLESVINTDLYSKANAREIKMINLSERENKTKETDFDFFQFPLFKASSDYHFGKEMETISFKKHDTDGSDRNEIVKNDNLHVNDVVIDIDNDVTDVCENNDETSDRSSDESENTTIQEEEEEEVYPRVSKLVSPVLSLITVEDFVIITQDEISIVTENDTEKTRRRLPPFSDGRTKYHEMKDFTTDLANEDELFPSIPLTFSWDKKSNQENSHNKVERVVNKEEEMYREENIKIDEDRDQASKTLDVAGEIVKTQKFTNTNNEKSNEIDIYNSDHDEIDGVCDNKEEAEKELNEKRGTIELTNSKQLKGLSYINDLDGNLHDSKTNFGPINVDEFHNSFKVIKNSVRQVTISESISEEFVGTRKDSLETKRCNRNCTGSRNDNSHNVTIEDVDSDKTENSSVTSGDSGSFKSTGDEKEVCKSCGQKVKDEMELTSESDGEEQYLKIFVDLSIE